MFAVEFLRFFAYNYTSGACSNQLKSFVSVDSWSSLYKLMWLLLTSPLLSSMWRHIVLDVMDKAPSSMVSSHISAVVDLVLSTICMDDLLTVCAMELTISLWRWLPLKWDTVPYQKLFVVCRFAFETPLEMAFDNQISTKSCCGFLWYFCLHLTINWMVNGILFLMNHLWKALFVSLHWWVELKYWLKINSVLILDVEVTGSHTNDANVLCVVWNFCPESDGFTCQQCKGAATGSNPVWEWTQQFNPELRFEWKVAKGTQVDIMKLFCFGPCQLDGWVFDESWRSLRISLSCSWSQNITRSDLLLWHGPQNWVSFESMISCLEALHPNPFVWLIHSLVCNLVYSFVCSMIPQIESNDLPELDFQLPSPDLRMHL